MAPFQPMRSSQCGFSDGNQNASTVDGTSHAETVLHSQRSHWPGFGAHAAKFSLTTALASVPENASEPPKAPRPRAPAAKPFPSEPGYGLKAISSSSEVKGTPKSLM